MDLAIHTVAEELGRSRFNDRRLATRLQRIAGRLAVNPALSFPKALSSSSELEGAYRFFGNPAVSPNEILSGHFDATRERCQTNSCALVIHDTTTLSFSPAGKRRGLGRLHTTTQSFFAHIALALSDDGDRRPLGVAGMMTWVRDDSKETPSEHNRWGSLVEESGKRLSGVEVVHVMDREADDYALFAQLVRGNHRFVVRSMHDRLLLDGDIRSARKLSEALATIEQVIERDAALSRRAKNSAPKKRTIHPPRSSRVATLAFGAVSVVLKRPKPHPRYANQTRQALLPESIHINVIRVWEPTPPPDEPAVEWVLLTSEPVDTVGAIVRTIERYRARWTIEEYFKALKTGCAYESRQLEDYESLVNALAVFAPIACTLLDLRSAACRQPSTEQTALTSTELEVLRAVGHVPLSSKPTTGEVLFAVAALGGHIKYNGQPGWITLGRGYAELLVLTRGWEAAKLHLACDQ